MTLLDTLIYDAERLPCAPEEKEACLETVRKLARLSKWIRRNGPLAVGSLAEQEEDPFFRACLLEFGELGFGEPEAEQRLERMLCGYLAAGNYRSGSFLNAVLVAKGLLLMLAHLDAHPSAWGELLSDELRGFFGDRKSVV